jgi:hypothetical protein
MVQVSEVSVAAEAMGPFENTGPSRAALAGRQRQPWGLGMVPEAIGPDAQPAGVLKQRRRVDHRPTGCLG